MKKRIISLIVTALMLMAILPVSAFAAAEAPAAKEGPTVVASWDFETDPIEAGWQFVDADGDNYNWSWTLNDANSGERSIMSCSYDGGPRTPDNWAITPAIELPVGTAQLTYYAKQYFSYDDVYRIYIGTTDSIEDMTPITEDMNPPDEAFDQIEVDLSNYSGQTVYIAFRHYNCNDEWKFYIDDVTVTAEVSENPEPIFIDTIELNGFVAPAWNELPFYDLTVPENAHYSISYTDWNWWDNSIDDGDIMAPSTPFNNTDYVYYQYFEIVADEGYALTENTTIIVNGDDSIVETSGYIANGNYFYAYTIDYTVAEPQYIDSIELDGLTVPAWGENPDFTLSVPEGAPYRVDTVVWLRKMPNGNIGNVWEYATFDDPDSTYSVFIFIVPNEGYAFANPIAVTINGGTELIASAEIGQDGCCYVDSIDFTVEEPVEPTLITEVNVTNFMLPVAGERISDYLELTVPENCGYEIVRAYWWCDTMGIEADPEQTFTEGFEYSLMVKVEALDGYAFSENAALLLNGSNEYVDYMFSEVVNAGSAWVCANPIVVEAAEPVLWGDANGDGVVNTDDALIMLRYAMGLGTVDEENLPICDVNGDEVVDMNDALIIMRYAMGLIEELPL